ncbi:MAG: Xaa-Pro dipeptidase [SAR324 cluster bacterium]|nr:Xaa-Pro dipeptidase [SAR324 cluster bacterium]
MELHEKYRVHVEIFNQRYAKILENAGFDGILIHAGSVHPSFLDDQHYSFKANPLFKSWLPLGDQPDCCLLIRPGAKPQLFFYQPSDYWYLISGPPEEFWADQFDLTMVYGLDEIRANLPNGHLVFFGEDEEIARHLGIQQTNPQAILDRLHYDRAWKTEYEQDCILEANRIAARGHLTAKETFYARGSEFEIQSRFLQRIAHREKELPYESIVALNEHGAVAHYQLYDHTVAEHRSLIIDAGAVYNGYASDITRTYSFEENEFAEIIRAMNLQQLALISEIKSGLSYLELHLQMHLRTARLLREFKFVDLEPESIVELNISNTFFHHGLGHLLGVQVHDVGGFLQNPEGELLPAPENHRFLRLTRKIEPNMVFTIEPGLYFVPVLLKKLKERKEQKYLNWEKIETMIPYGGVRIEDDICMKDDGPFNITRQCFAELKE